MKPRSSKINKGQSKGASQPASPQPALWSLLLRAISVGVGTVVCVMVLLGASGQDDDRAGANRKKIESMTPSERAQLKRNYEKFQNLSAQEKQRFRKIHTATRNQPKLNHVMRSYCDWVKTLSPWEQEDLRKAKTLQERMELIQKFRSQGNVANRRNKRPDYEILAMLEINPRDPRMMFFWTNSPPPDLYNEVIRLIEQSLPHSAKETSPKDSLSELEHSMAVLKLMTAQKQEDKNSSNWPSSEVMDSIYQLLGKHNYSFRNFGEQRGGRQFPREEKRQRAMLSFFLAKGLVNQLVKTVKAELDKQSPSDKDLQNFFESDLETKDKDNLMKYPPDDMQEKLKYLYLKKNLPADLNTKIKSQSVEVKVLISDLFRGIDLRGSGMESLFKRGKDRIQDRRSNGPKGPGNRSFRDQNPEKRPFGKLRKRPDA